MDHPPKVGREIQRLRFLNNLTLDQLAQKSGVSIKDVKSFLKYCSVENKLNVIGLMVLPPNDNNTEKYFEDVSKLNFELGLKDLSMGMSMDYKIATKYKCSINLKVKQQNRVF